MSKEYVQKILHLTKTGELIEYTYNRQIPKKSQRKKPLISDYFVKDNADLNEILTSDDSIHSKSMKLVKIINKLNPDKPTLTSTQIESYLFRQRHSLAIM